MPWRNSLVFQWLGLSCFTDVAQIQSLSIELRSCKLVAQKEKKKKNERNKLKNPMPWNLGQSISVKVKKFIYHSLQPSVAHWLKFILPQLTFPSFWVLSPYKSRFLWAVVCGPLWHFIQDSNLFCTSGYQASVFTVTDNLLHYKLSS